MAKRILQKNDFFMLQNDVKNILIFHIPTTKLFSITVNSRIHSFFEQLTNNIQYLTPQEFNSIEKILLDNLFKTEKENIDSIQDSIQIGLANYKLNTVILPISGKCNLKCPYCFAQTKNGFGFEDMSEVEISNIINFIMNGKQKEEYTTINFFGGEPFINLKIMRFAVKFVKDNYPDYPVNFTVTTNGTIMNNEIINFLKENGFSILVSIDGPKEVPSYRIFKNGKSSVDKVINNILKMKSEGLHLALRATLPNDCTDLVKIHRFFEELEIPFSAVHAYKSINDNNLTDYDSAISSLSKQYDKLLEYYKNKIEQGAKIYSMSISNKINMILTQSKNNIACGGGINIFAITNDGNIYTCEHLAYDKNFAVGNIFSGIDGDKLKYQQPSYVEDLEKCKTCWAKFLCSGGCFTQREVSNGRNIGLSGDDCALVKLQWKFIFKLFFYIKKAKYQINW